MKSNNTGRILLQEDGAPIKQLYQSAQEAAKRLNELNQLRPIRSREDYQAIALDLKGYIHSEMMKDPRVAELSEILPIEDMKVPAELQRLESLVKRSGSFTGIVFNGEEWEVDSQQVELLADKYRVYAERPEEIERYNDAVELVRILKVHAFKYFGPNQSLGAFALETTRAKLLASAAVADPGIGDYKVGLEWIKTGRIDGVSSSSPLM